MELKSFKRLSEYKVSLDGIIWDSRPEKANEINNNETGGKLLSIKIEDTFYYPSLIDGIKN
jgi:hypothetical protein